MELEHTFTVPVAVDEAWDVLRDIERVAPCMPGASIDEVDGDEFRGRVTIKVGPMQVTYRGTARFVDVDDSAHRAVIHARGSQVRGQGTAQTTVTAHLAEKDGVTEVRMTTEFAVTGRPAQFGRGTMAEVGNKLVSQFADCLSERLSGTPDVDERPEQDAAEEAGVVAAGVPPPARPSDEPIDLFGVAGAPLAKRLAPVAAVVGAVLALVWGLIRRRR